MKNLCTGFITCEQPKDWCSHICLHTRTENCKIECSANGIWYKCEKIDKVPSILSEVHGHNKNKVISRIVLMKLL